MVENLQCLKHTKGSVSTKITPVDQKNKTKTKKKKKKMVERNEQKIYRQESPKHLVIKPCKLIYNFTSIKTLTNSKAG
jgi:hypothetical protein